MKTIIELEKKVGKSKKCKMCIQLREDFGTDCPKHMKLKTEIQTLKNILELLDKIIQRTFKFEGTPEKITGYRIALKELKEEIQGENDVKGRKDA